MCCAQYYCPYLGQYMSWHKLFSVREEHVMYNNIASCTGFCQVIAWDNVLGPCICKCESLPLDYWGPLTLGTLSSSGVLLHSTSNIYNNYFPTFLPKHENWEVKSERLSKGHHLDKSLWSANEKQWFSPSDCIRGHCIVGIFIDIISVLSYVKVVFHPN